MVRPLITTIETGVNGGRDCAGLVGEAGTPAGGVAGVVDDCVAAGRFAGGRCRVLWAKVAEANRQIAKGVISILIGSCRTPKVYRKPECG